MSFSLSFLIFVFVGLRFSHNAAGALYRFKMDFQKMASDKKLFPIALRKGDFFKDVEEAFNEVVQAMDKKG